MINNRHLFAKFMAQTSDEPVALEIAKAEGCKLYGADGKEYIDLISGISVSSIGHRHPEVIKAIQEQIENYLHVMVLGELILSPQVKLAEALIKNLPEPFSNVFFVNSGSEANEGAIKLAKRYTGRYKTISFKNAYHGSTQGALSLMGNNLYKDAFRPLIPGNYVFDFNDFKVINSINEEIACVIIEPIQGEAGIIEAKQSFIEALSQKCSQTGTLLIFDEVQTGFGRTGKLFAFEHYNIKPDIITIAKAMGGGMPIGAFISSKEIMSKLSYEPILGHITTFGGHPVSCAASLASLNVIIHENLINTVPAKESVFINRLKKINKFKEIRSKGLLIAAKLDSQGKTMKLVKEGIKTGILIDWFLFAPDCIRIAPPLTIDNDLINESMDKLEMALKQI